MRRKKLYRGLAVAFSAILLATSNPATLQNVAADCRQSPGICRDFYYEHCFSGIIQLSERRCFL